MPRSKKQFEEIREKTKNNILNSALKLFAEKGYHGTSIADIAKAAGVSKGLAYNYFESKQKLVEAILMEMLELGYIIEKEMDKEKDPYKKIVNLINFTFDYIQEHEEYWRLYFAFALQPEILEKTKTVSEEFSRNFVNKLGKILRSIGIKNSVTESYILGAIFDGIGLGYFVDKENYPIKKIKKEVLNKYSKKSLEKLKQIKN